jgi:aminopeptidase N
MKKYSVLILLLFLSFSGFSQQKKITAEDSLRGFLSPLRSCYDVHFYQLSLQLDIPRQFISGSNKIYFRTITPFKALQVDLFANMVVRKIVDAQNREVPFSRAHNAVFVHLHEQQEKGSYSFIEIFYEGSPRKAKNAPWDGGFVWALDNLKRPWVNVACEGIGASLWWPCKDHPSDEPDSMTIQLEVPAPLVAIANGTLTSTIKTRHNTLVYNWKVSHPINAYNVTLYAGAYTALQDSLVRTGQASLPLRYYVLSYNADKAAAHFQQIKPILECYEKLFGPYPFPKDGFGLVEATYWGMEHQSAIAYGNRYQNNMEGLLDYILVHETAHEWWGNHVSASDHADLWIHEAFTTYAETLLMECLYGQARAVQYLESQKKNIRNKEPIQGPYHVNYHHWKDSDMYYKGAWMLHTLRHSIHNDSLWFSMLYDIQKKFAHQSINARQLIEYINTYTGYDYTSFFNQYLTTTQIPELEYSLIKKDKKTWQLNYRWSKSAENLSFPLYVILDNARRIKIIPETRNKILNIPAHNNTQNIIFDTSSFYINFKQIKHRSHEKD